MFWIVVAILTAAVAIVLMYPLMRKTEVSETRRDGEVAVYRDQLAELDRERAAGLIGETEADYARAEIGRRLLAAAEAEEEQGRQDRPRRHNLAASLITVLCPHSGSVFTSGTAVRKCRTCRSRRVLKSPAMT